MSRKLLSVVIFVIAFVGLALTLSLLISLPTEEQPSIAKADFVATLTLNDNSSNDITKIKIRNQYNRYTVRADNGICYIKQLKGLPIAEEKFSAILADCAGVAAAQIIDNNASDLSIFGLVNPKSIVEVEYANQKPLNLYIGNDAPSDEGIYVCEAGKSTVYLFPTSKVDTFFYSLTDFIEEYVTPNLNKKKVSARLSKLSIQSDSKKEITITSDGNDYAVSSGNLKHKADTTVVSKYASKLIGLKADTVVKIHPTESDLEKYGLSKPYTRITAEYGKQKFTLLTSKYSTVNGMYIIKDGTDVVYCIKKNYEVFDAKYETVASSEIISANLNSLQSFSLSFDGTVYRFSFEYSDKSKVDKVYCNGEQISYEDFLTFYKNVLTMKVREFIPETTASKKAILTVYFDYKKSSKKDDTVSFYSSAYDDDVLVSLNGDCRSMEQSSYTDRIMSDCKKLVSGQSVDAIV